jgi:hypothetical protein
VTQNMAQTINIPLAFEYRPRKVWWSLLPGPNRREEDGKDLGVLLQPERKGPQAGRVENAWTMRDEFFHLHRNDNDALLKFLNRWGWWRSWESFDSSVAETAASIWDLQQIFRSAVSGTLGTWLNDSRNEFFPMIVRPQSGFPPYLLSLRSCELAIRATITIDLLQRVEFRICARRDCRAPYAIESGHARKYCTQYCGHLVSVRKNRREQRKLKGEHHGTK